MKSLVITGTVWRYPGAGSWHFVNLPKNHSERIKNAKTIWRGTFGYIPVQAKIGKTTWKTALWPDKKSGTYLLVIKAAVRKKEKIVEGDRVRVAITL